MAFDVQEFRNKLGPMATNADVFNPISEVETYEDAQAHYFEIIKYLMGRHCGNLDLDEATRIAKTNIGYYAGYFDHATRLRVEEFYETTHPVLPPANQGELSSSDIFELGKQLGGKVRTKSIQETSK